MAKGKDVATRHLINISLQCKPEMTIESSSKAIVKKVTFSESGTGSRSIDCNCDESTEKTNEAKVRELWTEKRKSGSSFFNATNSRKSYWRPR